MDQIDRKLLSMLQDDARLPITELAERAGLTKTPCANRVRRLENEGLIHGYSAQLKADALGAGYVVLVQVTLTNTRHQALKTFAEAVRKVPEIQSCFMVGGGFDYLLKLRCADLASYRELLGDVIAFLPGVETTSTFVVLDVVKDEHSIPIDIS